MPASPLQPVLHYLRRRHAPAVADAELLDRFARHRDADAFASLVNRHGPMVLGACRRVLGDAHAAEDAFQATFLALARYACSLHRPATLPAWLYGVAVRTACRARTRRQRARRAEAQRLTPSQSPDPLAEVSGRELVAAIDEELARLPERYRLPLLLCGQDGLARDEVAVRLGWSLGALRGRLERGRELLRQRLTARGLTVPVVLAASLVADRAYAVPAELVQTVTRAALTMPVAAGTFKALSAVVLLTALGIGAGVAAWPGPQQEAPVALPQPAVAPEPAARVDVLGDPLPDGAVARLGSQRLRPGTEVEALAFSPDGRRLACWAGSHFTKGNLTLWDVATGRLLRRVGLPRAQVKLLHWLPDGRGCAVVRVGREEYYVWDFADETAAVPQVPERVALNVAPDGLLLTAAVSPDGRWLATGRLNRQNQPRDIEVRELLVNWPFQGLKSRTAGTVNGHCVGLHFTPDSRTLLSLSRTQEPDQMGPNGQVIQGRLADQARLIAWDVATGRERVAWNVGAPGPSFLDFGISRQFQRSSTLAPDGQTLVIGQQDGTVRLWDWQTGRERRSWSADPPGGDPQVVYPGGVVAVAVSGDGKTLFTGRYLGPRRLWDLTTGQARGAAEGDIQFHPVAVAPDGKRLATGSNDGQVTILDFATGANLTSAPGHSGWVERVRVLPDGRTALTAASDGTLRSWDLVTGQEKRRVTLESPQRGWPAGFTPDGRGLIGRTSWGGSVEHEKYLWDTDTGRRQPLAEVFEALKCWILTPPVNGSVLRLDLNDQTVTLRDWPSGRLRHTFRPPTPEPPATDYTTNAAALSADGRLAVVVGEDRRRPLRGHGWVSLLDGANGTVLHRWSTPDAIYQHVAFTPDGSRAILGGSPIAPSAPAGKPRPPQQPQHGLVLLDTASAQIVQSLVPPQLDPAGFRYITALAVSPDGRQLAAAERDHSIWLYELATGQARRKLAGHTNQVTSLAFTPDGRRLVSVSRDLTGLVWDVSLDANPGGARPAPGG